MKLGIVGLVALEIICVIVLLLIFGWKTVEKKSFSEFFVGQVVRMQKARIPGFVQYSFMYKKRGRTYTANSRLIWNKIKLKKGGLYKIQVFHCKLPKIGSTSWAVPIISPKYHT